MHPSDRIISWFSPERAFRRARYREAMAEYEAARPSRVRKTRPDNRSGDGIMAMSGPALRGYARQLEQNYDVAKGALDVLVNNIIGAHGITLEPQPRRRDGTLHEEFAEQIKALRQDWELNPEVTGEHDFPSMERLACRTWLRDGEMLAQRLMGRVPGLRHNTLVPYSVEMIEADQLPFDKNDDARRITQGVERNTWGRPLAFHLLREHPGDPRWHRRIDQTKRVSADRMLHLKISQRIKQARGVSIFVSVMRRLEDLKDYEESERIAARVAAALTGYIKKGTTDDYVPPEPGKTERTFSMKPGMVFDRLNPGEEVGTIDSNRPSGLLTDFHNSMVRSFSAGVGANYSSVSRNYDGSYSSQRQELVEGWQHYMALTALFVCQHSRPIHQDLVRMAMMSGQLDVPDDLDLNTATYADYRGPAMPWINPEVEAKAKRTLERAGYMSAQQIIRDRGGNPNEVMSQIESWRRRADEKGLVFEGDARTDAPPELWAASANDDNGGNT